MPGTISLVQLSSPKDQRQQLAQDALEGLTATPKKLLPKYFYDAHGSDLFEEITHTPEYYLTDCEIEILEARADEIIARVKPDEIIEIGSGSSRKTRLLLEALHRGGGNRYVPFDVSRSAIQAAATALSSDYPWLEVLGVEGDFEHQLGEVPRNGRRLVAFLGSTLGNLEPEGQVSFLRGVRSMLEPGDALLLGVDRVKDRAVLERAYNDSAGLSAAFNKNVLTVVNRELDGDFPVVDFEHVAFFNAEEARMEMWLRSKEAAQVHLRHIDLELELDAGEKIHTEYSHKFERHTLSQRLGSAGLALEEWYEDPRAYYCVALIRAV